MSDNIHVLILDDDVDDIFLIKDAMDEIGDSGYDISSVTCPKEAAEILSRGAADVVLCDYRMGQVTGIEFISEQREKGVDTPIILLTGMNDRSTDQAALAAGASDFISKVNIQPDTLDRSIRYALANVKKQRVFQSVLESVNAGVVLVDETLCPNIWNPEFESISERAVNERGNAAIETFSRKAISEPRILNVGNRTYEKKVSYTADKSMVLLLHDVTEHIEALKEREEAESRAAHLAMHCPLTELPNRNSFADKIKEEIKAAEIEGHSFFLLNLDLDKFKEVNDIYGHKTGDRLLNSVAGRLRSAGGEESFLARLGGDEFIAIQRCSSDCESETPALADRFIACMEEPLEVDGIHLQVGVSIGVSKYPEHGRTAEELMSNADTAMYRAKREAVGKVHAFNEEMDRKIREARMLGYELRDAVEQGNIDVHFQPQADVNTGEITGFEALARWNHPKLGYVSPTEFIPLAEERGLIRKLGQVVLEKACAIATDWPEHLKVGVNVSPVQIRDTNLLEAVHQTPIETGLPPNRLELEVTESVLIEDQVRALHVLRGLKNLGTSIALDDFGTGYSSLSTLIAFPFDKIKIDRSFVEECNLNNQAALVTRTIINMGIQLGCHIIAEGVQAKEHLDFLRAEGCHSMQGFLIGKPCPIEKLDPYLNDGVFEFPEPEIAVSG